MQAEVNYKSCESQEEKVLSFIYSQESMKHFKTYSDPGFSGGNLDRPALQKLLKDINRTKSTLFFPIKLTDLPDHQKISIC